VKDIESKIDLYKDAEELIGFMVLKADKDDTGDKHDTGENGREDRCICFLSRIIHGAKGIG
jgi:hypothetical protein